MGHDEHWFSDVVGAALLGVATTEFFIWLHDRHDEEPGRWRIFSMSEPGAGLASQASTSVGVGVTYDWCISSKGRTAQGLSRFQFCSAKQNHNRQGNCGKDHSDNAFSGLLTGAHQT